MSLIGENGDAGENREGHNSEERRAVHNYSGSYRDRYPGAGPSAQAPLPLHMGKNKYFFLADNFAYGPRCEKTCLRGFLTKRVSNLSPHLQRLANISKFCS